MSDLKLTADEEQLILQHRAIEERRAVYAWPLSDVEIRGQQITWLKDRLAACEAAILALTVRLEETRSALEVTEREKQIVTDLLCEKYQEQGMGRMYSNHRSVDHYLTIDVGPETSNGTLILTLRRTLTGAGRQITTFKMDDAREVVALYKSIHNARCFCRYAELSPSTRGAWIETR